MQPRSRGRSSARRLSLSDNTGDEIRADVLTALLGKRSWHAAVGERAVGRRCDRACAGAKSATGIVGLEDAGASGRRCLAPLPATSSCHPRMRADALLPFMHQTAVMLDIRDTDQVVAALRSARTGFEKGAPAPRAADDVLRYLTVALADSGPLELGMKSERWLDAVASAERRQMHLAQDSSWARLQVKRSNLELERLFRRASPLYRIDAAVTIFGAAILLGIFPPALIGSGIDEPGSLTHESGNFRVVRTRDWCGRGWTTHDPPVSAGSSRRV